MGIWEILGKIEILYIQLRTTFDILSLLIYFYYHHMKLVNEYNENIMKKLVYYQPKYFLLNCNYQNSNMRLKGIREPITMLRCIN